MVEPTVFVVDDDAAIRKSLKFLVRPLGIPVETFESAGEFLDRYDASMPGCLVLDVRMPGMSGLELQSRLAAGDVLIPIIIITGYGDVPMAVRALEGGALAFIEKPFTDQEILERINQALKLDREARREAKMRADTDSRISTLTPKEREVMGHIVQGKPNKVIAAELDRSSKTVEAHRARVMEKMQVGSLAELLRMVIGHQIGGRKKGSRKRGAGSPRD